MIEKFCIQNAVKTGSYFAFIEMLARKVNEIGCELLVGPTSNEPYAKILRGVLENWHKADAFEVKLTRLYSYCIEPQVSD